MLVLTVWLLLLQQPRPQVCPPAGSFRGSTDQGFPPSRAATFKKKLLKLSSIAVCGGPQAHDLGCAGRTGLRGERCLPDPEREVRDVIELEQLRIDVPPRRALRRGHQRVPVARIQAELDNCPGDVPRHVLATDEIMRRVMIERVGFDQASGRQSQPFMTIHAIVRAYAHHPPRQRIQTRRPSLERSRRRVSKSKRNIAPGHLEQLLQRRAAVCTGWKQTRACRYGATEL